MHAVVYSKKVNVHLYSANTLKTHITHCQRNASNSKQVGFQIASKLLDCADCYLLGSEFQSVGPAD